jgi:hypothetical protein
MGTWGTGFFDDDSALDFMAGIEESTDAKGLIAKTLDTAIKSEYIESDEGIAVIVAAAYIDRQVSGTTYSAPDEDMILAVDSFPTRNPDQNFSDLKLKAVTALTKILEENSEINELWAENDDDYPIWRAGVQQLIDRLKG